MKPQDVLERRGTVVDMGTIREVLDGRNVMVPEDSLPSPDPQADLTMVVVEQSFDEVGQGADGAKRSARRRSRTASVRIAERWQSFFRWSVIGLIGGCILWKLEGVARLIRVVSVVATSPPL